MWLWAEFQKGWLRAQKSAQVCHQLQSITDGAQATKIETLLAHKLVPQTALLILTYCQGQRHAEGPSLVVSIRKASSVCLMPDMLL